MRRDDPLLIRAAGGIESVLRYAWKSLPMRRKKRWAQAARTVQLRGANAERVTGGGTPVGPSPASVSRPSSNHSRPTVFARAPAAKLCIHSNGRHRAAVGVPVARSPEVVLRRGACARLCPCRPCIEAPPCHPADGHLVGGRGGEAVSNPRNFLRGSSPYRVPLDGCGGARSDASGSPRSPSPRHGGGSAGAGGVSPAASPSSPPPPPVHHVQSTRSAPLLGRGPSPSLRSDPPPSVKIDYHLASSLRAASAAPVAGGVLPSLGLGRGGRHGAVAGLTQHAPCLLRGRQSDFRPPLARGASAYLMYDVCNILRES
eukprot:COSAG01_NODE_9433_length_2447_cov_5.432709_2_plen_315_part_00